MKIFSKLYSKMLIWAEHRHAPFYLAGVSMAESCCFPLPSDIMLAPMIIAKPHHAWRLAMITACSSVMGGIVGYLIGFLAYDTIGYPLIAFFGLLSQYERLCVTFQTWGAWIILVTSILPIPYKLSTLTAGATAMPFFPFVIASFVGRHIRYFVVAFLLKLFGIHVEKYFRQYIDYLAWSVITLIIILIFYYLY